MDPKEDKLGAGAGRLKRAGEGQELRIPRLREGGVGCHF